MRSKKWSIIVSLIIIIMGVSVLIFSILNFHWYTTCFKNWMISFMPSTALGDWKNFFIVISSGVLTSSVVTLLISISEYRVEKRRALENYVDANIHFCADFYNMLYMNISIPIELLQGYYAEQWSYSLKNRCQKHNSDEQPCDSENEIKIKDWIWENTDEDIRNIFNTDEKKKEFLDSDFKRMIQKYDEEIDAVMKQYIALNDKVSKRELNSTIGEIDFLFGNKYRKEVLHKRMYQRHAETISKIRDISYHFKEYYNANEGNKPVMLRFIQQIQDHLFLIEENDEWRTVHNKYLFEINCEIDNLFRRLYGKKHYHDVLPQIKDFTVVSYWKGTGKNSCDE